MLYCEHRLVEEDEGIGHYEYWGAKGVDTCMVIRCEKCDMSVSSENADRVEGCAGVFQAEDGNLYLWDAAGGVVTMNYDEAPNTVIDEVNEYLKERGA